MLKYPKYIIAADDAATAECVEVLRVLYKTYGTDAIAEAHHQLRREFDMIPPEPEPRLRRTRAKKSAGLDAVKDVQGITTPEGAK